MKSANIMIESDIRRALQRFPPTMMDINDSIAQYKCLQCTKPMKKIIDLKKHIQKKHAEVPEFRCVFCPENKPENRFSTMKRDHMYQV